MQENLHDRVYPEQIGNYIFIPKEGFEDFEPKIQSSDIDDVPPLKESLSVIMKRARENEK